MLLKKNDKGAAVGELQELNMFPCAPIFNALNRLRCYTILSGNRKGRSTLGAQGPNSYHIRFRQLGFWVALAANMIGIVLYPLSNAKASFRVFTHRVSVTFRYQSIANGVGLILGGRYIFKILKMIVRLIPVFVINFVTIGARADKGGHYKLMHFFSQLTRVVKCNYLIAVAIGGLPQNTLMRMVFVRDDTFDVAARANGVVRVVGDYSPLFGFGHNTIIA